MNERGYHMEKQPIPNQPPSHLSDNMYRMQMPMSSAMLAIPPQNQQVSNDFPIIFTKKTKKKKKTIIETNYIIKTIFHCMFDLQQMQGMKPGGSITQGYPPNRASSIPHPQQGQGQPPPQQMPPMHYPRHRY